VVLYCVSRDPSIPALLCFLLRPREHGPKVGADLAGRQKKEDGFQHAKGEWRRAGVWGQRVGRLGDEDARPRHFWESDDLCATAWLLGAVLGNLGLGKAIGKDKKKLSITFCAVAA